VKFKSKQGKKMTTKKKKTRVEEVKEMLDSIDIKMKKRGQKLHSFDISKIEGYQPSTLTQELEDLKQIPMFETAIRLNEQENF
jgi:uncharacterized protein with GYD domain